MISFLVKTLKIKILRMEDDTRILTTLSSKILPKLKTYFKTTEIDLLYEILQAVSALVKKNQLYKY